MVKKIKLKDYCALDIFVLQIRVRLDRPKTIIFINKIKDGIVIADYLQLLLSETMRTNEIQIIKSFSSNMTANTKEFFMQEFKIGNTYILICIDIIGISINIRDVAYAIQLKIMDYFIFVTLSQQIRKVGWNKVLPAISIIFVKSKHIFFNNIASI